MEIWRKILETAVHAPSPHNVQPWRVKISDERNAELYIDSTRTLPKEDVTGSFIILTMGMFLESLKILAADNGFDLTYELFHEPDWYAPAILQNVTPTLLPFAKLELVPCRADDPIYPPELFFKRRTSRLSLLPKQIPPQIIEDLKAFAEFWQQRFEITVEEKQIERLLKYNTEAVFADLNSKDYHDEIVEWFRFSEKQSRRRLDGLDYRCMNTPRSTFWLSARYSWLMKTPLLSSILAKIYRRQTGTIPTIGLLSGKFWSPADAIETGKFLMRFWLETARHNLYIHPFGNLVTNPQAARKVLNETGVSDVWLIFKIGYSAEPPKSYRLPVEKILVGV